MEEEPVNSNGPGLLCGEQTWFVHLALVVESIGSLMYNSCFEFISLGGLVVSNNFGYVLSRSSKT